MTPPPLRSTLFPYTTLFRSNGVADEAGIVDENHTDFGAAVHAARWRAECLREEVARVDVHRLAGERALHDPRRRLPCGRARHRSEEHTSELQSRRDLVCRLL